MWRCWTSPNHNPSLPRRRGLEFASDCGRMAGDAEVTQQTGRTIASEMRQFALDAANVPV
jgi:hypothetical protein